MDEWTLHQSGGPSPSGGLASGVLARWADLEERERALDLRHGQPFLLPPNGVPDRDVLRYFNSLSFKRLAPNSQMSYAYDLRVYLSFLLRRSVDWRDVSADDINAYEYWRREDEANRRRVGGAKLARELAACRRFYAWQQRQDVLSRNPIEPRRIPRDVHQVRMKWLTDEEYVTWCNVGLRGTMTKQASRVRNVARNLAFVETLWASGLRLREAATLLTHELPGDRGEVLSIARLATAVAKTSGRDYWISGAAIGRIRAYRNSGRAGAIRRAQAEGRYEHVPGILVVQSVTKRRQLTYRDQHGQEGIVPLDNLTTAQRTKLYVEGDNGLEPAMVWLTGDGMPMSQMAWQKVFEAANNRCEAEGIDVRCNAHKLRHTFAMRWLVLLRDAYRTEFNLAQHEQRMVEQVFGNPFVMVQHLLGHRNVTTTEQVYLEPAQSLNLHHLVNHAQRRMSPTEVLEAALLMYRSVHGAVQ